MTARTLTSSPGSPQLVGGPPRPSTAVLHGSSTLLLHGARIARTGAADLPKHLTDDLARHVARIGEVPRGTLGLVDTVERAGLTGHGGAHVPVGLKWRRALQGSGPLTVVANAAESEPLSAKDAVLLHQRPHLVIDGLVAVAQALGAVRAVVWLHAGDDATLRTVHEAVRERRLAGLPGTVEVVVGPGHYLAGESSAIAQAMDGGPALPTARRREGPGARPRTLVHNVETLARVALLARGHRPVPTTLLTVLTPHDRQVVEVEHGTPVTDVLAATGWLDPAPLAVLLGGFGGMWVAWRDLVGTTVDEAGLRAVGLSLGAGVVAPIPVGACGLTETAAMAHYLADMSARQCGPCLFGLPALAESMRALADGAATSGEHARLLDDLRAVTGRGACHHPDGATRLIASALDVFAADVEQHARGRVCRWTGPTTMPVPAEVAR